MKNHEACFIVSIAFPKLNAMTNKKLGCIQGSSYNYYERSQTNYCYDDHEKEKLEILERIPDIQREWIRHIICAAILFSNSKGFKKS